MILNVLQRLYLYIYLFIYVLKYIYTHTYISNKEKGKKIVKEGAMGRVGGRKELGEENDVIVFKLN